MVFSWFRVWERSLAAWKIGNAGGALARREGNSEGNRRKKRTGGEDPVQLFPMPERQSLDNMGQTSRSTIYDSSMNTYYRTGAKVFDIQRLLQLAGIDLTAALTPPRIDYLNSDNIRR